MTIIKLYKNKRNPSKCIEVHNDGHYHNSVQQYMMWINGVKNPMGDGHLHRWKRENLNTLLEDYELVATVERNKRHDIKR